MMMGFGIGIEGKPVQIFEKGKAVSQVGEVIDTKWGRE
jgi:hypothetical protein